MRIYLKLFKIDKWLFPGQDGENNLTTRSAEKIFEKAKKKAGIIKTCSIHILRHSFATHLMEGGTDIRIVQELLGHFRPETTMIYTNVLRKDLKRIQSPLDTINLENDF